MEKISSWVEVREQKRWELSAVNDRHKGVEVEGS